MQLDEIDVLLYTIHDNTYESLDQALQYVVDNYTLEYAITMNICVYSTKKLNISRFVNYSGNKIISKLCDDLDHYYIADEMINEIEITKGMIAEMY